MKHRLSSCDDQGSTTNSEDRFTRYEYSGPSTAGVKNWTVLTAKRVYDNLTGTGSPSETHEYQYNNQGQMSQSVIAKNSVTTTTTYKYNDERIRVSQTEGTTTTIFHNDPNNHTGYAQVLEEGVDDSADGKLQSNEVDKSFALGHDVLAEATSAAAVRFLLYDGHGSTRALVNSSRVVVESYAYDTYGIQLSGTGLNGADAATTRLLYSGKRTDKTGLQYLRERYYNPGSGRFTTLDPFAGNQQDPLSLHKHLYVHGDPISGVDPSGLEFSLGGLAVGVSVSASLGGLSGAAIGGIANGTDGAIQGFQQGFLLGAAVGFGVLAGGAWLAAPLLGVSELTGIYITGTAASTAFTGLGIYDVYSAETPRERAAATAGLILNLALWGYGTYRFGRASAGRGTFENFNPNATAEDIAMGRFLANELRLDLVAREPVGTRGVGTADYSIRLGGGKTVELKNMTGKQAFVV